jgi:membrane protease subunit (stomatin/prohibitin family)
MGLLRAGIGALTGVLADQWRDYFCMESMEADVLAVKAVKRMNKRFGGSKNVEDNIISNGSIVAVNEGQCMLIVDQGKVVEVSAEPGEFVYDTSTEPSIFYGDMDKESVMESLSLVLDRLAFGGQAPKDQRVYFINTKEIVGNKYGTPSPVPFRVVDNNIGLDVDISVRCFGEYSYKVANPLLFYANVCGNVVEAYTREQIDGQLKTELLTALQPAFASISELGIRYSALPGHTAELSQALNSALSEKWAKLRGIVIVSFGVSSVKASEENEKMIKELQRNAAFRNPNMAAAQLVGAQAQAMQDAAKNEGGAFMGFMGMNAAQGAGGVNAQALFQMGAQQGAQPQQTAPQPARGEESWKCGCGHVNTGKFCMECGGKKPEAAEGWTCACGAVNKGKFCAECGAKKPEGVKATRCDKCGWEPADKANPPKFCPECGDVFDDSDKR